MADTIIDSNYIETKINQTPEIIRDEVKQIVNSYIENRPFFQK